MLSIDYKLELDKTIDGRTQWDQDKISLCLQTGLGRKEFLDELYEVFSKSSEELKEREEDLLPDEHWKVWMECLRTAALNHFKKHKKDRNNEWTEGMKNCLTERTWRRQIKTGRNKK